MGRGVSEREWKRCSGAADEFSKAEFKWAEPRGLQKCSPPLEPTFISKILTCHTHSSEWCTESQFIIERSPETLSIGAHNNNGLILFASTISLLGQRYAKSSNYIQYCCSWWEEIPFCNVPGRATKLLVLVSVELMECNLCHNKICLGYCRSTHAYLCCIVAQEHARKPLSKKAKSTLIWSVTIYFSKCKL